MLLNWFDHRKEKKYRKNIEPYIRSVENLQHACEKEIKFSINIDEKRIIIIATQERKKPKSFENNNQTTTI